MAFKFILQLYSSVLPDVSVTHDGGSGTLYAGSVLTLTCTAILPPSVSSIISDFSVISSWTGVSNGDTMTNDRVTVSPASRVSGTVSFVSTVEFNTLRTSDTDTYTCTATVTYTGPLSLSVGQASDTMDITVISKCNQLQSVALLTLSVYDFPQPHPLM